MRLCCSLLQTHMDSKFSLLSHRTDSMMLVAFPKNRRTAQLFSLTPIPLAFLAGLLLGLFGALVLMDDDSHATIETEEIRRPTTTLRHQVFG